MAKKETGAKFVNTKKLQTKDYKTDLLAFCKKAGANPNQIFNYIMTESGLAYIGANPFNGFKIEVEGLKPNAYAKGTCTVERQDTFFIIRFISSSKGKLVKSGNALFKDSVLTHLKKYKIKLVIAKEKDSTDTSLPENIATEKNKTPLLSPLLQLHKSISSIKGLNNYKEVFTKTKEITDHCSTLQKENLSQEEERGVLSIKKQVGTFRLFIKQMADLEKRTAVAIKDDDQKGLKKIEIEVKTLINIANSRFKVE